ncbi:hypothetical protein [Streptomyces sp. NPDC048269]|uniref:hypothetical protein n=1 Tax=Streptomyces sp. NPDC048269 TaxID=3155753 RepID=UPI003428007B
MAKNKQQKQPKQQARSSAQDPSRSSAQSSPESTSQAPSPMDLAHKSKTKKFGHN